ncbi:MAG: TonB family protein [Thalassotalea sp.]
MSKYSIIILSVLCLLQTGCSLGPSASYGAYKAYDSKEYKDSIRKVTRALSKYEYSITDKSNLLFLKANSYLKLGEYANAEGVFRYLINTYPHTEAAFRAKAQLTSEIKKTAAIDKQRVAALSSNRNVVSSNEIPWPIVMVEQKYPKNALKYQLEGSVKLAFDISEKGTVINIRVLESSPSEIFVNAATKALSMWRYKPVTKDISKEHIVVLGFEMKNNRPNLTMRILA